MSTNNTFHTERDDFGEVVCSKAIRCGKRTYFIDVKATQADDYYLVLTESKRHFNEDGTPSYTRHHLYLYKEDFGKFTDGLSEMINYIKSAKPEYFDAHKDE